MNTSSVSVWNSLIYCQKISPRGVKPYQGLSLVLTCRSFYARIRDTFNDVQTPFLQFLYLVRISSLLAFKMFTFLIPWSYMNFFVRPTIINLNTLLMVVLNSSVFNSHVMLASFITFVPQQRISIHVSVTILMTPLWP